MPIVIDGNNLLHRLPTAERSRGAVRNEVLEATRHERMSITVVFDGPPPAGAPTREGLGSVTIVYAGSRSADDVIVESLSGGPAARQWTVVTDDRGLAARVKGRGAAVRSLAEWQQRRRRTTRPGRPGLESKLSSREVDDWESYFSDRPDDEG